MFAANEDNAEKGASSASARELRTELLVKEKEKDDVSVALKRDQNDKEEHEKEVRMLSGVTFSVSPEPGIGIETSSSDCVPSTSKDTARKSESVNGINLVDSGHDGFINDSYEEFPHGTPRLAALQSNSNSLAIWRRFSRVHCRLLQRMQNQITKLEQQLDMLDKKDTGTEMEYRLARNDWDENWDRTQEDLLDELKTKISEFDDLLIKDSQLRRLAPTPSRDHLHLFNWILGTKPLDEGHYDFIFHNSDFISSSNVARTANGVDSLIESCLSRWPSSLFRHFLSKTEIPEDPHVYFFSRDRIALVARLTTLCIAVTILLVPIFIFSLSDLSRKTTLLVVLVFVLLFATIVSLLTGASVESMFVGTCTYAAVLVTFLGNVQIKA